MALIDDLRDIVSKLILDLDKVLNLNELEEIHKEKQQIDQVVTCILVIIQNLLISNR